MRKSAWIFGGMIITIFALCLILPSHAFAVEGFKRAVFIRPDREDRFWALMEESMRAAASDLGVALEVYRVDDDPFRMVQKAEQIATSTDKPDAVFFETLGVSAEQAIAVLDRAGIDVFTLNTELSNEEKKETGGARQKYKHWIGQSHPDDQAAGKEIAEYLYLKAKSNNTLSNGKIKMAAIQGKQMISPSSARLAGLYEVMHEYDDLELEDVMEAYWEEKPSREAASYLLKKHPGLNAIWAVNDNTAIGAIKAIEDQGLAPGKDIFVAGIDWLPEVFDYIKDGKISASLGGHFMEGAFALIMVYDYRHGHDFAQEQGVDIKIPMNLIDYKNIGIYGPKLKAMEWKHIDFKKLTKTHNPDLVVYNFNVLDLLNSQKKVIQKTEGLQPLLQ